MFRLRHIRFADESFTNKESVDLAAPKKKSAVNVEEEKQLTLLLDLLDKLSIQVKYARGYFHGGLVRYKDRMFLYLNRAAKTRHKIEVIANELQYIRISPDLLTPEIRRILKNEGEQVRQEKVKKQS